MIAKTSFGRDTLKMFGCMR